MPVAFRGQPSGDFVLDTIQLSSKCGRVCGARDAVLRAPRLHLSFRNNMLISPYSAAGSGFAKCRCSHWWSVQGVSIGWSKSMKRATITCSGAFHLPHWSSPKLPVFLSLRASGLQAYLGRLEFPAGRTGRSLFFLYLLGAGQKHITVTGIKRACPSGGRHWTS